MERQDSAQSGHTPSLSSCLRLICFLSPETGHLHGSQAPAPKFHERVALPDGNRGPSQPRHPRKVLAHGGGVLETQPPPPCETPSVPPSPPPQRHSRDFSLLESHASSLPRAKTSSLRRAGWTDPCRLVYVKAETLGHGLGKQGCWYRRFKTKQGCSHGAREVDWELPRARAHH